MSAFEALGPDGRALWRTAYDLLKVVPISDVLEYSVLEAALGRDRSGVQTHMRRAATELLRVDNRAIVAVPNVGYRVVEPERHLDIAKGKQQRSSRQLQRGRAVVTHVDMTALEPTVRKAFEVAATAFSMQIDFNRRIDIRQKRIEEQVAKMTPKVERTAEEVEELKRRLAALEEKTE